MNPEKETQITPESLQKIDGNQEGVSPPSESMVLPPTSTASETPSNEVKEGVKEDGRPSGLELILEKKEGEVVVNFCVDCAPKVTETMVYFQGVLAEIGSAKEEEERLAKRLKMTEGHVQYLQQQVEERAEYDEVVKFRDFVASKFEEFEKDLQVLKTLTMGKSKVSMSPMDQWKNLVIEHESVASKKRRK